MPSLELLDSKYLFCRNRMLEGSCSARTSLMGEVNGKVAQLTTKEKHTGLSLTTDAEWSSRDLTVLRCTSRHPKSAGYH